MTSASVSNMTVQVAASLSTASQNQNQTTKDDFMKVMTNVQDSKADVQAKSKDVGNNLTVAKKPSEIKQVESPTNNAEAATKVTQEVDEFAEDAKKLIADELGVSQEDVEKAMEVLGLTFLDLNDTTNLTKLVSELTGSVDNVSLLLSDSFSNIAAGMQELFQNLEKDTKFSLAEIKDVMSQVSLSS